MKKLLIAVASIALLTAGCKEDSSNAGSPKAGAPKVPMTVQDKDGNVYRAIKVGDQFWMDQNLKVETKDSWCYDEDPANCEKYGRLYTWNAAMGACPEGWALPNNEDWEALKSFAEENEGTGKAGKYLKAGGASGLDFPLAGDKYSKKFQLLDSTGYYWSSSEDDVSHAYDWVLFASKDDMIAGNIKYSIKANGLSVRCIMKAEKKSDAPATSDTFMDERNGKMFKVVRIGDQLWFAENLTFKTPKSKCMRDNCNKYGRVYTWTDAMQIPASYANKKFQSKGHVKGVCPDGWHIPSYSEWEAMLENVKKKVKEEKVWASLLSKDECLVSYNWVGHDNKEPTVNTLCAEKTFQNDYYYTKKTRGTNMFGFNAQVVGIAYAGDAEDDGGISYTAFWTSTDVTEKDGYLLVFRQFFGNVDDLKTTADDSEESELKGDQMLPVRCVSDK